MKSFINVFVCVVTVVWAVFNFLVSNSPDDITAKAEKWQNYPLVRSAPDWLLKFASSQTVLAVTFFVLGCVATVLFTRWRSGRGNLSKTEQFGTELSLAGYSLENMSDVSTSPATVANINVVINKMRQRGYAIPPVHSAKTSKTQMAYFFHQVGAYLDAGDEIAAKRAARNLVEQWPKS
jgi:hypothetical protein